MKNIIIYSTKYGFVEKCIDILKYKLKSKTDILNIASKRYPDLNEYEWIILGSSIYAGRIQKDLNQYIEKNIKMLLTKKTALFICSGAEGEKADKYLKDSFPGALYDCAISKEVFGGEFKLEKLTFLERFVIERIIGIKEDFTRINEKNINNMALVINNNS